MSTDFDDMQSTQTHDGISQYSAGSTLLKGSLKEAKASRGEELQNALYDHLAEDTRGKGMNWDYYAQCRLQDFEQR